MNQLFTLVGFVFFGIALIVGLIALTSFTDVIVPAAVVALILVLFLLILRGGGGFGGGWGGQDRMG